MRSKYVNHKSNKHEPISSLESGRVCFLDDILVAFLFPLRFIRQDADA